MEIESQQAIALLEFSGIEVDSCSLDRLFEAYDSTSKIPNGTQIIPELTDVYEEYFTHEEEAFLEFLDYNESFVGVEFEDSDDEEEEVDYYGMVLSALGVEEGESITPEILEERGFNVFDMQDVIDIFDVLKIPYLSGGSVFNAPQREEPRCEPRYEERFDHQSFDGAQLDVFGRPIY